MGIELGGMEERREGLVLSIHLCRLLPSQLCSWLNGNRNLAAFFVPFLPKKLVMIWINTSIHGQFCEFQTKTLICTIRFFSWLLGQKPIRFLLKAAITYEEQKRINNLFLSNCVIWTRMSKYWLNTRTLTAGIGDQFFKGSWLAQPVSTWRSHETGVWQAAHQYVEVILYSFFHFLVLQVWSRFITPAFLVRCVLLSFLFSAEASHDRGVIIFLSRQCGCPACTTTVVIDAATALRCYSNLQEQEISDTVRETALMPQENILASANKRLVKIPLLRLSRHESNRSIVFFKPTYL